MLTLLKKIPFPATTLLGLLAVILVITAVCGNVDLVHWHLAVLTRIESHEVDDLVTALVLIVVGLGIDHVLAARRVTREAALEAEKVRVLHMTMRTVQDIVNNCLQGMQLLRLEGDEVLPPASLAVFDRLCAETAEKLQALGNLHTVPETPMAFGMGIDYRVAGKG